MEPGQETQAFLRFLRRKADELERAGLPPRPIASGGPTEAVWSYLLGEEAPEAEGPGQEMERLMARLFRRAPEA